MLLAWIGIAIAGVVVLSWGLRRLMQLRIGRSAAGVASRRNEQAGTAEENRSSAVELERAPPSALPGDSVGRTHSAPGQDLGGSSARDPVINPSGGPVLAELVALVRDLEQDHPALVALNAPIAMTTDSKGGLTGFQVRDEDRVSSPLTLADTITGANRLQHADRAAIVTEIGRILQSLHSRGWSLGGLHWDHIEYHPDSTTPIVLTGLENARPMGSLPAVVSPGASGLHTPADAWLPTFDRDRYQFALLVHRVLLAQHAGAHLDEPPEARSDSPFDPVQRRRLDLLRSRAAGPSGTRPTVAEWLSALSARPDQPQLTHPNR